MSQLYDVTEQAKAHAVRIFGVFYFSALAQLVAQVALALRPASRLRWRIRASARASQIGS